MFHGCPPHPSPPPIAGKHIWNVYLSMSHDNLSSTSPKPPTTPTDKTFVLTHASEELGSYGRAFVVMWDVLLAVGERFVLLWIMPDTCLNVLVFNFNFIALVARRRTELPGVAQ